MLAEYLSRARGVHADPGRIVICAVSAAGDVEAMLLTPAHQFPPGVALSPARRRVLAARDGLVIEDDYDGEFRYDRQPVGAVQALAPDRVIYAGTASKSLAPGVKLAWLPRLRTPG